MRRLAALLLAAATLAGCADAKNFLGIGTYKPPLPGQRISILQLNQTESADPGLADTKVLLPEPFANPDWPEPGGYPSHAMQHLALGNLPKIIWTSSIGAGSNSERWLLSEPIVAAGRVFAMDARSRVSAFDANSGARAWRVNLAVDVDSDKLLGGGVAYDNGKIFAGTSFGFAIALEAATGKEIWRRSVNGPMRTAPAVADGRVFAVTIDNVLHVLAEDDGRELWTHSGLVESAGMLGTATPAVLGDEVVVVYSSGEIYGLKVDTGRTLWTDTLAGQLRGSSVESIADIRGRPVIDRNLVIAISHSGIMAALDAKRGDRLWDADFGGIHTPWVAGDYVFVLTDDQELICLTRAEGRVRWVSGLPKFSNPPDNTRPILWQGPVLAGNRLILTGTSGKALAVSPYTGKLLGEVDLPSPTHLPPIVAGSTLYILSDDADLIALR
jgi:outer membrane protein assembly factor BamB